jgi:hypothetical protein
MGGVVTVLVFFEKVFKKFFCAQKKRIPDGILKVVSR